MAKRRCASASRLAASSALPGPLPVCQSGTGRALDQRGRPVLALAEYSVKEYAQGDQTGKTVRLRLSDKLTAAAQLAKLLGMLHQQDPMAQIREQMGEARGQHPSPDASPQGAPGAQGWRLGAVNP